MPIPKSKLAILIGAMKPKGEDHEDEPGEIGDSLSECAEKILGAVKADDSEKMVAALKCLVDHIRADDVVQDAESDDEED